MQSLWPSRAATEAPAGGRLAADVADTGVADMGPEQPSRPTAGPPPSRPPLLRGAISQPPPSVPPPPSGPPPDPNTANGASQQPPDSLSLAQLRRIVAEFPRSEPVAYDFVYEDTGHLDEEVDEWFVYQPAQFSRLYCAQRAFETNWQAKFGPDFDWNDADVEERKGFLKEMLNSVGLEEAEDANRLAVFGLVYVVLGRWAETAGGPSAGTRRGPKARSAATQAQLDAMKNGVELLAHLGGIAVIWEALRAAFERSWMDDPQNMHPDELRGAQDRLANLMTIMYIALQETLSNPLDMAPVHRKLLELNPGLTEFMMNAAAKLRWDESNTVPQGQVFLLFWKSLLLVFGGSKELEETKRATSESTTDADKEKDAIMASPLDYHVFRQEITSKYPAYIPPQSAIPLEAEQTSLLAPLSNQPTRNNGSNGILPGPPNPPGGASILHQAVHIATPAPSPPPSPGVGGKGGRRQNYQTNQNFPFMYPPLDATSNSAGGKGLAGLQDALVGRKWEGSDVPVSILEAGELFSKRVRMTRATRQLWDERERYVGFNRGYRAGASNEDDDLIDELDLSSLTLSEREELGLTKPAEPERDEEMPEVDVDYGPQADVSDRVRQRLEALESFYKESLPQLQSLVIVLLKAILMNVAILISQLPPGQQHPMAPPNGQRPNGPPGPPGVNGVHPHSAVEPPEMSHEELDAARSREISTKAVSGILLLLLKWLKVSHVLKFEYLTQLLLDCNYVPLLLKLWAHQDVQQLVDSKTDRAEYSFFFWCNTRAGAPEKLEEEAEQQPEPEPEEEEESEDEAAPPPIKRRRSPSQPSAAQPEGDKTGEEGLPPAVPAPPPRPEVDELGYPVNPLPNEPITDFSRRNFFSLINLLRAMQKVCKHKAHRNLLLVHYKSSNILRKMLKVPQPELRLYTLKLFKNQVPYCGRKWRQGNMRVITAVYLHCRPELRDEWLAGSDVDAEVEEALPLEQALRSLTHWFNVRRYPGQAAPEVRAAIRLEQDFFVKELERQEWGWDAADGESIGGDWEGIPG